LLRKIHDGERAANALTADRRASAPSDGISLSSMDF